MHCNRDILFTLIPAVISPPVRDAYLTTFASDLLADDIEPNLLRIPLRRWHGFVDMTRA